MYASFHGHIDVVHALLSGGAQPDLQDEVSTVYPCSSTCSAICRVRGNYIRCAQNMTRSKNVRHSNDMHASNDIKPGNGMVVVVVGGHPDTLIWSTHYISNDDVAKVLTVERTSHFIQTFIVHTPTVVQRQHWMNLYVFQDTHVIHCTTFL